MEIFLIGLIVGPLVGYLIGKPKNLGGLGAVLGFFLGFIGWIIVAVMKPKPSFDQPPPG